MTDALRHRLAELTAAAGVLDALLADHGDQLPPLMLARAVVDVDEFAARMERHLQLLRTAVADRCDGAGGVSK